MEYIIKYRNKNSYEFWKYYECISIEEGLRYLEIISKFQEFKDLEYKIYKFLEKGDIMDKTGFTNNKKDISILDFLYFKYNCNDLDTLKCICPINLESINLKQTITQEIKDKIDKVEELENEQIYKILRERNIEIPTKTFSLEEMLNKLRK